MEDLHKLAEVYGACVLESEDALEDSDESMLRNTLEEIEEEIDKYEKLRAKLGRVLDYHNLKKQGFSAEQVRDFAQEDAEYIAKVDEYYARNLICRIFQRSLR